MGTLRLSKLGILVTFLAGSAHAVEFNSVPNKMILQQARRWFKESTPIRNAQVADMSLKSSSPWYCFKAIKGELGLGTDYASYRNADVPDWIFSNPPNGYSNQLDRNTETYEYGTYQVRKNFDLTRNIHVFDREGDGALRLQSVRVYEAKNKKALNHDPIANLFSNRTSPNAFEVLNAVFEKRSNALSEGSLTSETVRQFGGNAGLFFGQYPGVNETWGVIHYSICVDSISKKRKFEKLVQDFSADVVTNFSKKYVAEFGIRSPTVNEVKAFLKKERLLEN